MSAAATLSLESETPWLVRSYDASFLEEEGALMYLLGVSYTRSRAGFRAEANRAGGSRSEKERERGAEAAQGTVDKQLAFLRSHRFIWAWLLENASVTLLVDARNPGGPTQKGSIWAWLLTTGDVIHAVGAKRSLVKENLAADAVRELLGDRLRKHQVCSLELPQMRTSRTGGPSAVSEAIGIDRPSMWSMDPTWLVTRMPHQ